MQEQPSTNVARKSGKRIVGIVVGIALLAGGGWLALQQFGLDATLVKQQLDTIAKQLRDDGKKDGRHIALSYGDIEMAGGALNRHALVRDVSLLLKQENGTPGTVSKPNSLLITSAVMELHTRGTDRLTLRFLHPIIVASEEAPTRAMLQVSGNAPLSVTFGQTKVADVLYAEWEQALPSELRVTYLKEEQAAGAEDQTPTVVPVYQTVIVTSAKAESFVQFAQDESGLGNATLTLDDVRVMPEGIPEGTVSIGQVRGRWSHVLNETGEPVIEGNLTVNAIEAAPELIAYAPITLAFDARQQGHMPRPGLPAQKPSSYQLKTFSLKAKNAAIDATADFASQPGETLPVGTAKLSVKNLPFVMKELKHFSVLDAADDPLLTAIIERVAGKPYADITDVDVAIARPKNGAFTIGKSTFEELFALVLTSKINELSGGNADVIAPPQPRLSPETMTEDYGAQG